VVVAQGSTVILNRVARRGRPFQVQAEKADCSTITAVVGTVRRPVTSVVAVLSNGLVEPVALREPPARWHYRGKIAHAVVDSPWPVVGAHGYDRHGRLIKVLHFPAPRC
jgi:hypothetical protein